MSKFTLACALGKAVKSNTFGNTLVKKGTKNGKCFVKLKCFFTLYYITHGRYLLKDLGNKLQ